jgi:hypothetical protein
MPEFLLSQSPVVELEAWPVNEKGLALFAYAGWDQFQLFGDPIMVKVPAEVLGCECPNPLRQAPSEGASTF